MNLHRRIPTYNHHNNRLRRYMLIGNLSFWYTPSQDNYTTCISSRSQIPIYRVFYPDLHVSAGHVLEAAVLVVLVEEIVWVVLLALTEEVVVAPDPPEKAKLQS